MKNHFLKASDEATLRAALIAAGILYRPSVPDIDMATGEPVPRGEDEYRLATGFALDVIGIIHKPTGNTVTVDGVEIEEAAPVPGWHANLSGDLSDTQMEALRPVILDVQPTNPFRVWA